MAGRRHRQGRNAMMEDVVERLYQALVDELQRRDHPHRLPVKVAGIYDDLVPYAKVRSVLGVEVKADYEHALLRLLAGEGDRLRLEPEDARDELRREVAAPYPAVDLFRKFSASDVWVSTPEAPEPELEEGRSADPGGPPAQESAIEVGGPGSEPDGPTSRRTGPRLVREERSVKPLPLRVGGAVPRPEPTVDDPVCAFCEGALPAGTALKFCPHCGEGVDLRPCPGCGKAMERDWKYCVHCGRAVEREG